MQTLVKNVNIAGIATCVPERQVDVFDNKNIYSGNIKKLNKVVNGTGFHKRHVLKENSKVTASDMCQKAAEELIKATNINKNEIAAVVMLTQYPDYFEPATACVLHGKLGLSENCLAFDINQGCAGYVYALLVCSKLVNNACRKILFLCGDSCSRAIGTQEDVVDDMPIFGDGGCATILEYDENAAPIYFDLGTQGEKYKAIIFNNGGFRNPPVKERFLPNGRFDYGSAMDGLGVFEFTMNTVPTSINNIMNFAEISDEQVDYYVLHQANKMI